MSPKETIRGLLEPSDIKLAQLFLTIEILLTILTQFKDSVISTLAIQILFTYQVIVFYILRWLLQKILNHKIKRITILTMSYEYNVVKLTKR